MQGTLRGAALLLCAGLLLAYSTQGGARALPADVPALAAAGGPASAPADAQPAAEAPAAVPAADNAASAAPAGAPPSAAAAAAPAADALTAPAPASATFFASAPALAGEQAPANARAAGVPVAAPGSSPVRGLVAAAPAADEVAAAAAASQAGNAPAPAPAGAPASAAAVPAAEGRAAAAITRATITNVLEARAATMTDAARLFLAGASPNVAFVYDDGSTAGRETGQLPVSSFVSDDFSKNGSWLDSPQAVVHAKDRASGNRTTLVLTLRGPVYNASAGTLAFNVTPAAAGARPKLQGGVAEKALGDARGVNLQAPAQGLLLTDVVVFIDDSSPPAEAGGRKSSVVGNVPGSGQLVHMSQSGANSQASAAGSGGGGAFGRGSAGYGAGGLGRGGLIQTNTGGGGGQDPYYRWGQYSDCQNTDMCG